MYPSPSLTHHTHTYTHTPHTLALALRSPVSQIQKAVKTVMDLAAAALDAMDTLDASSPSTRHATGRGATGGGATGAGFGDVGPLSRLASSSLTALREMVSTHEHTNTRAHKHTNTRAPVTCS